MKSWGVALAILLIAISAWAQFKEPDQRLRKPPSLLGSSQPIVVAVSGTPTAGQTWNFPCPTTMVFPPNFAGIGHVSCGTSLAETDIYSLLVENSQIGTITLTTACSPTSGRTGTGVTFASTNGAPQICNANQQFTLSTPAQISLVNSTVNTGVGGGTNLFVTLTTPTGASTGDVLVACIAYYQGGIMPDNIPAGFGYATGSSTTSCQTGGGGGAGACVYTNALASTPASTYQWSWTSVQSYPGAAMMAVRGINTASVVDTAAVGNATSNVGGNTAVSVPYGTTTQKDLLASCIGFYSSASWATTPQTNDTTITQQAFVGAVGGSNVTMWLGTKSLANNVSGNVTGTEAAPGGNFGGVNIPLKLAANGPVSGGNLGFTIIGQVPSLP